MANHRKHSFRGWLKSTSPECWRQWMRGSLKTTSGTCSDIVTYIGCLVLLNPQIQTCSGTAPWLYRSSNSETHWGWSPIDSYPDVGFTARPVSTSADLDCKETSHMVTGAQGEIHFCSLGTSSGKQMKAWSTSQPQCCIENIPTRIEVDQFLLALKQLATNSNFAKFDSIIKRFSKLAKYLTTTMPTFDGKSENFELFEEVFQTSLKIHNQRRRKRLSTSLLSCVVMVFKLSKTSPASTERI